MARNFNELRAQMSPARRAANRAVAEEMSLRYIEERLRSVEEGRVTLVPHDESMRHARARILSKYGRA